MKGKTLLRLLGYARPHWRGLAVVLAALLLQVGLDVLRPWPVKLLVDQVLGQRPVPETLDGVRAVLPGAGSVEGLLFWVCASTVLLFLAGKLAAMAGSVARVRLGQRMTFDLGADLFRHVQRLSLLFHSRRPVGDTLGRVTGDTYCLQDLLTAAVLPVLESAVTLAAMFLILWHLDAAMTLVALGVVPFLALVIWGFRGPLKSRVRARRDLEGRLMALVEQSLSAIPAVQAFTREEQEDDRFRRVARETEAAYLRATWAKAWFGLLSGLVTAVGTAVIMWLGATQVLAGKLTVGDVLVFLAYLGALYGPLSSLTETFAAFQQAAANADRVLEILDTAPDVRDPPGGSDVRLHGHVRYDGVTFGYESGRPVLTGATLEARPGEVVAIVGPTGAGKTTLVNLLVRFFDPWSGRVTVDGHDLRTLRLRSLRRQVALVLQEPFLFPISVAENIAYGRPDATRAEIEAAAAAANADGFVRRLPDGYDAVLGERGTTLSGGEKQRLAIARAFLKDAPILILDEPTSALDARTEGLLLDALDRLMKGRTTFIIAHRLSTIRHADRILVLDRGAIVEQGRHAELLARGGLYAGLYRRQMEFARHDGMIEPDGNGGPSRARAEVGP